MSGRVEVLRLYRQFLRVGSRMALTSSNHGLYVLRRAKAEFKEKAALEGEEAREAVELARVLLESLRLQEVHKELGKHRSVTRKEAEQPAGSRRVEDFW